MSDFTVYFRGMLTWRVALGFMYCCKHWMIYIVNWCPLQYDNLTFYGSEWFSSDVQCCTIQYLFPRTIFSNLVMFHNEFSIQTVRCFPAFNSQTAGVCTGKWLRWRDGWLGWDAAVWGSHPWTGEGRGLLQETDTRDWRHPEKRRVVVRLGNHWTRRLHHVCSGGHVNVCRPSLEGTPTRQRPLECCIVKCAGKVLTHPPLMHASSYLLKWRSSEHHQFPAWKSRTDQNLSLCIHAEPRCCL